MESRQHNHIVLLMWPTLRVGQQQPAVDHLPPGGAVDISTEQVGAVRRRWLFDKLKNDRWHGAMWLINTLIEDFPADNNCQGYGDAIRRRLWRIRTDLNSFGEGEIACLENHGYSLADAAMRSYAPAALCQNPVAPFQWPHPDWIDDRANAFRSWRAGLPQYRVRHIQAALSFWPLLREDTVGASGEEPMAYNGIEIDMLSRGMRIASWL